MHFYGANKRGFTMVELLVAIFIIGILATVVVVSAETFRKKARDTERRSDMETLSLALRMYRDTYGAYPVNASNGSLSALNVLVPDFLTVLPNDPLNTGATPDWAWSNQNTYYYWGPGNVGTCGPFEYTLWYRSETESEGTAESCIRLDNNSYTRHP